MPAPRIARKSRTKSRTTKRNKIDKEKLRLKRIPFDICKICHQDIFSILMRERQSINSKTESIALVDEKLCLFKEATAVFEENEFLPYKVTSFTVYDTKGHLCPIDMGLIEDGVDLYFSGIISPVHEENFHRLTEGIPAHDLGPITEWFTLGYDGGDKLLIGLTTQMAAYCLVEPSTEYAPLYESIHEKVELSRIVIQFLLDKYWENPVYEDLLKHLKSFEKYSNPENMLLQNVKFIFQRVQNYDQRSPKKERPLISMSSMKTLLKISGHRVEQINNLNEEATTSRNERTKQEIPKSKVVASEIVKNIFKDFFKNQIYEEESIDQGDLEMATTSKENVNKDLQEGGIVYDDEESDDIDEGDFDNNDEQSELEIKATRFPHTFSEILQKVEWISYKKEAAIVGDITVQVGDHVFLKPQDLNEEVYCIAKIIFMFEGDQGEFMFHGEFLCRSKDTILGETGDPRELFQVHDCENLSLNCIVGKTEVNYISPCEMNNFQTYTDDREVYYVCKKFLNHRFEEIENGTRGSQGVCYSCGYQEKEIICNTPIMEDNYIRWKNENYFIGSSVFLCPNVHSFPFNFEENIDVADNSNFINDVIQPEYYRKQLEEAAPIFEASNPFTIGLIENIRKFQDKIYITVRIFYRPENTVNGIFLAHQTDLNCLYYTERMEEVVFDNIAGKCYLSYGNNLDFLRKWSQEGPKRFYFMEKYDTINNKYVDVPEIAKKIGNFDIPLESNLEQFEIPSTWEKPEKPLQCMDIFAGCGGLSEGLRQSGLINTKWAIEINPVTANAYRQNFSNCRVVTEDCNIILKMLLNGDILDEIGLPGKGEVEILIAGPPCQGFSSLNRFRSRDYSVFQNSLIVTFLSYCDYYRPKYIVFESVRNFVSFNRSLVLKLTIRCLLVLGYQVTYGIMQAGQYGIPQSRRRFILMASAPGCVLPKFPEIQNVFSKQGSRLNYIVDNWRYDNGCQWIDAAPYRMLSVRDALTDLPGIKNGDSEHEKTYDSDAISHFQRLMRFNNNEKLWDHICKNMCPLVQERIKKIPTYAGADWRDLPNIPCRLPDNTLLQPLRYLYRKPNQTDDELPRGVCQCAIGGPCNGADKQTNTLIPWSLPHTADKNNHWSGIYGRLEWGGYFRTTVTNPEPMGKQGRVIHPEQDRVVSVRECARSQGFPDTFIFSGTIMEKHRQIGNAVPPPLAAALGREICKALALTLNEDG